MVAKEGQACHTHQEEGAQPSLGPMASKGGVCDVALLKHLEKHCHYIETWKIASDIDWKIGLLPTSLAFQFRLEKYHSLR